MKRQAPVFLGFFAMGFVDVVGIATNYAKKDFQLRDSVANLLPLMVFVWFALLSVPVGVLMNRVGRRMTVVIGLAVTALAMLIPMMDDHFAALLIAFALVGIGNTILQVSLNPLLSNVVRADQLTSALTAGQLAKSLASFLGPVIAAAASVYLGSWREMFWVFAFLSVLNGIWLWLTPIPEVLSLEQKQLSSRDSLRLLSDGRIAVLVLGVVGIVGIDVGLNTTLPRFVMERCNLPLEKAGFATSGYFFARTAGSLMGIPLLARLSGRRFLALTSGLGFAALILLISTSGLWVVATAIVLLGLAVANVFPILFAAALQRAPSTQNEVSGLMIMGVAGGAVMLPIMGFLEDTGGAAWAIGLLALAWLYLWWISRQFH